MEQRAVMAEPISEQRLIEACQAGDRDAFRELFESYKDKVYSIALYSLAGDRNAASDVSQQIFLKLMTNIAQFRGDSAFTTWMYRMVVNACHDEQRKRRRFLSITDWLPTRAIPETRRPDRQFEKHEISDSVQEAIQKLSPKLRMPVLLKYMEGLSYEEIADVMGCSKGTVASRLNRAHHGLAEKLSHLRGHGE